MPVVPAALLMLVKEGSWLLSSPAAVNVSVRVDESPTAMVSGAVDQD